MGPSGFKGDHFAIVERAKEGMAGGMMGLCAGEPGSASSDLLQYSHDIPENVGRCADWDIELDDDIDYLSNSKLLLPRSNELYNIFAFQLTSIAGLSCHHQLQLTYSPSNGHSAGSGSAAAVEEKEEKEMASLNGLSPIFGLSS
ncbi:hypothetical protein L7F22_018887 [Adiantum nelumboides]|nr:hypothetical protein [Adiantum nelumboides]